MIIVAYFKMCPMGLMIITDPICQIADQKNTRPYVQKGSRDTD